MSPTKQIDMSTMTRSGRSSKTAQKLDGELTASNTSKAGNAKPGKAKPGKAKPSKAKDSKALNTTKRKPRPNVRSQPASIDDTDLSGDDSSGTQDGKHQALKIANDCRN